MKSGIAIAPALASCVWLIAFSGAGEENEVKLTWNNGESLAGEFLGASDSELTWKSPIFAKPVPLSLSSVRSVIWEGESAPPDESMAFNLRDGSRIYGELVATDETSLSVESKRHGEVRLKKSEVLAVYRLKGGRILWCGPTGEAGWRYGSKTVGPGLRLQRAGGGAFQMFAWRQRVALPLELPEKVEIEFRLSSTVRPEFVLTALAEKQQVTLTTWDDELVIRRGNQFVSLEKLEPDDREVNLRIFWDRQTGSGAVVAESGELLGKWQAPAGAGATTKDESEALAKARIAVNKPAADLLFPMIARARSSQSTGQTSAPVANGVAVANRGPDIRLEFLRVMSWDGELPQRTATSDPSRERLEVAGGAVIAGHVVGGDSQSLVFREKGKTDAGRSIPIGEIESIHFPVKTAEENSTESKQDELGFADGGSLCGRLLEVKNGVAKIENPMSEEPVAAVMEGIQELLLRSATPQKGEDEKAVPFSEQDRLLTGATTIHGAWHPAKGKQIHWRVTGAARPVEIASTEKMEIVRTPPKPGGWPRSSALFHLANGQVAPGDLVAIDDEGATVNFRSEITEAQLISAGDLHAIQFRGPEVDPKGFGDPGWRIVSGGKEKVDIKDGTVTMEPGGAWGHPFILAGDEIRFKLGATGHGTIRVRMFCDGTSAEAPCSNFLLAHFGSQIYCGIEETPGQLNQQRELRVEHDKPVEIRFNWDKAATKVFVNGSMAIQISAGERAKRSGIGLRFEPASIWGNSERQITVSDFALRAAPGFVGSPGVNAKAKEKALFLPRFRKEDPPHHVLLAPNGDLLRGTIVAAGGDRFAFRSGLEDLSIPMDRVAVAIWLVLPEEKDDSEDQEKPEAPGKEPESPEPTHWLQLTSGAHLELMVKEFGPEHVAGQSAVLGPCRIPVDHVHSIRSNQPESASASPAFSNWQLKRAPEPVPESGGEDSPMLGKAAPSIDLALLDGGRFKSSDEIGKVLVLDFWATWCGPCVRALPDMIREFSQFDRKKARFIGLNQAEAPAQIQRFVEQRGWGPFEVALDSETAAGRAYGIEGIPFTAIIDQDGKVAWVSEGFRPEGAREAAEVVRKLLLGNFEKRVAKILNAGDIRDVGIQAGRFDEYVGSLLSDLVSIDREKALEIFSKAVEIVERSREEDCWKFKPGDRGRTFVGDVVAQLRKHADPVSWLAFQADLMRSETIPPFEISRLWADGKLIDALVRPEGDSSAMQSLESVAALLEETLKEPDYFGLVAPILMKAMERYDLDTVVLLLAKLDSEKGKGLSPMGAQLHAAARVHLWMRERFRGRELPAAVEAHFLNVLENESVPLSIRFQLTNYLCSGGTPKPSREIVLAGIGAIADSWKGDTPLYQFNLMETLDAFLREEQDEVWKAAALRLGDGFRVRYLSDEAPSSIPHLPDDDLVELMMEVYRGAGDSESSKEAFSKFAKRFIDFGPPIIHFVRTGEFAEALELLTGQSRKIALKDGDPGVFDADLEKNTAAFLDQIENSGLRLLAETLIAKAGDPVAPGEARSSYVRPGSPKGQRLQAVAEKYGETDFSSSRVKREVHRLLSQHVGTARVVADELREAAKEIEIGKAIDLRTQSTVVRGWIDGSGNPDIFQGALMLAMEDGDLEEVDAMFQRVVEADANKADRKAEFIEEICELPARVILESAEPEKAAEALIPLCQRIALGKEGLELRANRIDKERFRWAQLTFAMLEAGRMDEFLPWLRKTGRGGSLKELQMKWNASASLFFGLAAEKFREQLAGQRIEFLNELLSPEWVVSGFYAFTTRAFRNCVSGGFMTADELLENGEAMARATPRKGQAWNDLAFVFAAAGRLDEALKYWGNAIDTAEFEKQKNQSRTNQARALFHQGRIAEARKAIEGIDPAEFDDKTFADLREKLNQSAEEAEADAGGKPIE